MYMSYLVTMNMQQRVWIIK